MLGEDATGRETADNVQFEEAIEEGGVTETTSNVEEVLLKLASVKYPIDPAHNQAVDLKCNASFVKMCVDRGLSTWS